MRTAILSEKERDIIDTYLSQHLKLEGFSVLRYRIKRHIATIKNDLKIIEKFLEREAAEWERAAEKASVR